jgi:hypothetical protein
MGNYESMRNLKQIKDILKRIPYLPFLYYKCVALTLKLRPAEDVFTDIFEENKWEGKDSISGSGSDIHQTKVVISEFPIM